MKAPIALASLVGRGFPTTSSAPRRHTARSRRRARTTARLWWRGRWSTSSRPVGPARASTRAATASSRDWVAPM